MLKTLGSTESTTRPGKGGVGVGGDGGDDGGHDNGATSSMLRTSSSTDSSTSVAQTAVEDNGVDGGCGKSVEKSSKSRRVVKKSEEPQRPEKSTKSIGSEEPSFLNSDTRLAFTKDDNGELLAIVKVFKNWRHYLKTASQS